MTALESWKWRTPIGATCRTCTWEEFGDVRDAARNHARSLSHKVHFTTEETLVYDGQHIINEPEPGTYSLEGGWTDRLTAPFRFWRTEDGRWSTGATVSYTWRTFWNTYGGKGVHIEPVEAPK